MLQVASISILQIWELQSLHHQQICKMEIIIAAKDPSKFHQESYLCIPLFPALESRLPDSDYFLLNCSQRRVKKFFLKSTTLPPLIHLFPVQNSITTSS